MRRAPRPLSLIVTVIVLGVLTIGGCAPRSPAVGTSGGIRGELSVSPRPASALRPVTLRLRLTAEQGEPVALEGLAATADMPEMSHGSPIAFRPAGSGEYEATHTFSMDGRWEIIVRGMLGGRAVELRVPLEIGE